jgi:sulfite exporter TauE/SafE
MLDWIAAGLAFGFVGSAHCVGMCGPLAMGLPGLGKARARVVAERLIYNAGRVVSYTSLGVVFGAFGVIVALGGYQGWLSLGLGVLLLLAAFIPVLARRLERAPSGFVARVTKGIGHLYRRGGAMAMLGVGVLNGLLPCGFVYAALAATATADSVGQAAGFMAAFGLGTIPAMLAMSLAGRAVPMTWRLRLQQVAPFALAILGILLVLRGLSLGTFLSPNLREAIFTPGLCRFLPLVEPV